MRLPEVPHRGRQRIARLRVRGGHRQPPLVEIHEFRAGAAQVLGLLKQALDDGQHGLARGRQAQQPPACAHEELHAELLLELADLAADAGLRGVQRLGHERQVEALADGLAYGAQLLEVHGLEQAGAVPAAPKLQPITG